MSGVEANEAQARRAAAIIVEAVKTQAQTEASLIPPSDRGKWAASAPAWLSLVLTLVVGVYTFGVRDSDIQSNTRRIVELEARQNVRERDDRQLLERMARIEAKLDTVLEAK